MYMGHMIHSQLCCCVLQCVACVAVCCSVLQCVAVCCSVLHVYGSHDTLTTVLQCVAVCCSVLQRVAVCCSVLQCVAACCMYMVRMIHSRLIYPCNVIYFAYTYILTWPIRLIHMCHDFVCW